MTRRSRALTELEDEVVALAQNALMPPERKPEPARVERAKKRLTAPLGVLDAALARGPRAPRGTSVRRARNVGYAAVQG